MWKGFKEKLLVTGVGGTLWLKDLCYKCANLSYFYQEGKWGAILLMLAVGIASFLPALCRKLLACQQSDNRSLQTVTHEGVVGAQHTQ